MPPKVVVVTGPTASGKTALSILLAQKLGGEIVSADSMQIYRHMDIGTAKPTPEEQAQAVHHMIDVADPDESWSVSRYVDEAGAAVDDILKRGKLPIICGGTGLYIDSLISGTSFSPSPSGDLREKLSEEYDAVGGAAMLEKMAAFDPISAAKLHPNDKKRIVRAFEVYTASGTPISRHNEETASLPPRYEAGRIVLTYRDRQALYNRIDSRVDAMIEAGLFEETKKLLKMGIPDTATSMQAIGYKEIVPAVRGEVSLTEAAETLKMNSRRYAKRQLSWLRRIPDQHYIMWDTAPDFVSALRDSTEFLEKNGII